MINIKFTSLKYFYDAVLFSSIKEAAKYNLVTYSCLHIAITDLEKTIGFPLHVHNKNRFTLTQRGQSFFEKVKEILKTPSSPLEAIGAHPNCQIKCLCSMNIGHTLFPPFHPTSSQVDIRFGDLAQHPNWLENEIIDFAIDINAPLAQGLDSRDLYQGHFHLYKIQTEKRDPQEIGIYITDLKDCSVQNLLENHPFLIKAQLGRWDLILQCIQKSGGYGLIPDLIASADLIYHADISIPFSITLYTRQGKTLNLPSQTFIDQFTQHINHEK